MHCMHAMWPKNVCDYRNNEKSVILQVYSLSDKSNISQVHNRSGAEALIASVVQSQCTSAQSGYVCIAGQCKQISAVQQLTWVCVLT